MINIKGKGHRIALDVDVSDCQLQDFLALAVKTEPPVMSALISTTAKLQIRPGTEHRLQKLGLDGKFTLKKIHFTNREVQDKVDMLSLRAQEANPRRRDRGRRTSLLKCKADLF